jgi:hypothetical protein
MERIPVRHIKVSQKEPDLSEIFSIRDIQSLLAGNDTEAKRCLLATSNQVNQTAYRLGY